MNFILPKFYRKRITEAEAPPIKSKLLQTIRSESKQRFNTWMWPTLWCY